MKLNFDLSLQQTQKLIMTQQLQMAIKILQMPSIELHEYIQEELVENPLLELGSNGKSYEEVKIDWRKAVKSVSYDKNDAAYNDEDEEVSPLNFIANATTLKDHL